MRKRKKKKRVEGGGKLNYYLQLDKHLMNWYRSKRGLDREGVGVHKEKVTFKGLILVEQRFCDANKLKEPSKQMGKRTVAASEEKHYATGVKVFFSPKSVINTPTIAKYMAWWLKKSKTVTKIVHN
ncbi:unnamed protein product [Didymodactylos carnosus]|uniref:Uncharacterized protein n=1 Tax=Didymodactylos carnosus TaxID=1234261 RepID=A0A816BJZ9_9BILA|nr:unnamed protein product [Didymodactylos carnosus]CAF1610290.1 unnamed protein product [Didymodactylos carnosus]CAF4385485.1 unnamed protein product [Didymodactylos carnosus]CAF4493022.1 unnamed protein product [Didymodactylos carnosus]